MKQQVLLAALLAALAAGDSPTNFTSPKAIEAQKAYEKSMDRLKVEYDAKVKKAQADYRKALDAALLAVKKSKDSAEAARIEKAIEELKSQTQVPEKGARSSRPPEKGPDGVTFIGGDGESLGQAVVIKGAGDSVGAVDAETWWLKKHFPKHTKIEQALQHDGGKDFDVIEVAGPEGQKKKIYFDITDCFGFPKE